jgi:hypothetical protein
MGIGPICISQSVIDAVKLVEDENASIPELSGIARIASMADFYLIIGTNLESNNFAFDGF